MPYELAFQLKDQFIQVNVQGERHADRILIDAITTLKEIDRYATNFDKSLILIHWNVSGIISREHSLDVITELENLELDKNKVISIYFDNEESLNSNVLIEKLAPQLDWNIKFFDDSKAALKWLLEQS